MPTCWTSRHECARVLSAVAAMLLASIALAAPPELTAKTYASKLIGELQDEMESLNDAARSATATQRIVLNASTNVRILAADLLTWGDLGGAEGSHAVICGIRLSRQRQAIDTLLDALNTIEAGFGATPEPAEVDRFRLARDALRQFNELAIDRAASVRTRDVVALDRTLAIVAEPLATAIELLSGEAVVSHWISSASPARDDEPEPQAEQSVDLLIRRVESASISGSTRDLLMEILDFLVRGEVYVEYRPYVRAYLPLIENVLRLNATIGRTAWLTEDDRRAYEAWIDDALRVFRNRETRGRGEARLQLFDHSRALIELIGRTSPDHAVDPVLRETLFALERELAGGGETASARRRMETLAEILHRRFVFAEVVTSEPDGDLRAIHRQMARLHERAQTALFDRIQHLGDDPAALADPSFSSLVLDHHDTLENLRLLQSMPAWIERAAAISERSERAFQNQLRRVAGWLLEPVRRDEALRVVQALESQFRRFDPMPFEDQLRAPEAEAIAATGALHVQLAQVIREQRQEWIEAWSRGDFEGDDTQRMEKLHLLLRTMSDTGQIHRLSDGPALLNRWAPMELAPGATARALSELPNRLKLATAAVIDGDDEALTRHIESMQEDALLVMLLGRLTARIGDAITDLPDGPVSIVGQMLHPPIDDAWLIGQREQLAHLCRYVQEMEHAQVSEEDALAYDLRRYVDDLARRLIDAIDGAPPVRKEESQPPMNTD